MRFGWSIVTMTALMQLASVSSLACERSNSGTMKINQQTNTIDESLDIASSPTSRRKALSTSMASLGLILGLPNVASARYVLNEDGDYEEIPEEDWQTTWKQRLDKASNMSSEDIFNAARGAGNLELKEGEESDASKKRRAMSACRDADIRSKAGVKDAKACNSRVMGGDFDFILEKL